MFRGMLYLFFLITASVAGYVLVLDVPWSSLIYFSVMAAQCLVVFGLLVKLRRDFPLAYNVAVVGFPQSGKTSLITAMFSELFTWKIVGVEVSPRGEETIEKINEDIRRLELGERLGPTKEVDLFAYRADIVKPSLIRAVSKNYKFQIGDFPGEDSEAFASKYGEWIHRTKYFNWVMNSDAFLFVIDGARLLSEGRSEYIAKIQASYRAAWQIVDEFKSASSGRRKKHKVIVVVTKIDLACVAKNMVPSLIAGASDVAADSVRSRIYQLGFVSPPQPFSLDEESLEQAKMLIGVELHALMRFFEGSNAEVSLVCTSVVGLDAAGRRYGVRDLVRKVLP